MATPRCHDPDSTPAPGDAAEPTVWAGSTSRATLVGDTRDAVAFLDAPGVGAQELLDTIDGVLARMPIAAILTVFTDDLTVPEIAPGWSAGRHVELLAVIPHGDRTGTTLTFRRAAPGSGPDATHPPRS